MNKLISVLVAVMCSQAVSADLPKFADDKDADAWLRATSPFYHQMTKVVDGRGSYQFRSWDQSGGCVHHENGTRFILMNPNLKGAERVSILIFEISNAYQEPKHNEIDQPARTGAIKDAEIFAVRHELIEYDGLRYHRDVLAEIEKAVGGIPREMLTWINPPLTTLDSYLLPLAHDYLEAQHRGGHTDHYRKYFPTRQAEKP